MARTSKFARLLCGIVVGILFSTLFVSNKVPNLETFCKKSAKRNFNKKTYVNSSVDTNLLMVGVMTAPKYLQTRAKAVYETWGREVPGQILFYSSEGSRSLQVPLVALDGVDDSYPPQKKSLMMLKHMYDNYIDDFEWFMRADDDVYVRADRLEELLRSVDSKKSWFIGQTGRGNSEEFGLLSLESDENFCMGGPGVIFSRDTLKRVAPYVDECLGHLYTNHEDVELGRCVRRFAGVSCTWSYQMQVIFYHNQSGSSAFTGDLKQKEIHRAITLHPIKHTEHMYRLHKYLKGLKIQDYGHESVKLHRDIAVSMNELGYERNMLDKAFLAEGVPLFDETNDSVGDSNYLGVPSSLTRFVPENLDEVFDWELISSTLYSARDLNPKKRIGSSIKEGLKDVINEVMDLINSYSKQRGRLIDFKETLYCYWRLDPLHGVDLILDLLLVYRKYRGNKMTIQVRRHAYVQRTFTALHVRKIYSSKEDKLTSVFKKQVPIHEQLKNAFVSLKHSLQPYLPFGRVKTNVHMILPISGRFKIFKRFLGMYEDICLKNNDNTYLYVILYKNEAAPQDFQNTLYLINDIKKKYFYSRISIVTIEENFSRGKALQHGVNQVNEDDLMLFIDVDMIFTKESLERIRKNTIYNKTIYFPIVYSQYNPKLLNVTYPVEEYSVYTRADFINENRGFWRQFGFGIVSLYKSDYNKIGGFNLMITGWGFEDVTFYDNVVKSNLKIVRCADPGLVHVYHPVRCDKDLDYTQRNMCLGTQASTLGSFSVLQSYFLKYYKYLFS